MITFLCFTIYLLFQDPTFLEIAFEMSKTGFQVMKDNAMQRNGDQSLFSGKRPQGNVSGWWAAATPIFGRDRMSREIRKSPLQFEGMRKLGWGNEGILTIFSGGIKSLCCEKIFWAV